MRDQIKDTLPLMEEQEKRALVPAGFKLRTLDFKTVALTTLPPPLSLELNVVIWLFAQQMTSLIFVATQMGLRLTRLVPCNTFLLT